MHVVDIFWKQTSAVFIIANCKNLAVGCKCWHLIDALHAKRVFIDSLTHWVRVTHIYVSKLTIIGSDNSLSPGRRQAIIWTNDGILLIGTLETDFSEILSEINIFSLREIYLKISPAKMPAILSRPQCANGRKCMVDVYRIKTFGRNRDASIILAYTYILIDLIHNHI